MAARPPSEHTQFTANMLTVVGGLMVVLCGGCTLFFDAMALPAWLKVVTMHGAPTDAEVYDEGWSELVLIASLVVGWIPTLIGIVLLVLARRLRGRRRPSAGD